MREMTRKLIELILGLTFLREINLPTTLRVVRVEADLIHLVALLLLVRVLLSDVEILTAGAHEFFDLPLLLESLEVRHLLFLIDTDPLHQTLKRLLLGVIKFLSSLL